MKCYELEGLAYQLLEFSMSQEVKKGPFAALVIESSQKKFLMYFQETNEVLFTYYQR